jgi:putative ABC transport system permease protein
MTRTILGALLSHWRHRPVQAVTLVLGLALATALWTGVQAINSEARASYAAAAEALGQARLARIVAEGGGTLPDTVFGQLRRAGWPVSPVIEGQAVIGGAAVTVVGFEPLTAPPGFGPVFAGEAGGEDAPDFAAFFLPPGQLIAHPDTAARIGAGSPTPVAVAEGAAPGIAFADIGIAQRILRMEGRLSHLVMPAGAAGPVPLETIAPGLRLIPPEAGGDPAPLTDSFHLNLTAFGLLAFAVGLFIVRGAVGLAFEARRPVVRTLRALGVPIGRLVGLMVAELALIALVAGALGVALGYGIALVLIGDVAGTLRALYGATVEGQLALRASWVAGGIGIAVAGTLLAAVPSLWQVARMPPLAPARPRAWAMAHARAIWPMVAAAAGLAALALVLGLWGRGLVAGFVLLAALLVASALLLPPVLFAVLRGIEPRLPAGLPRWFAADTRQQLPQLSLALMALMLALSANVGVGTMVASFRLTFTGWLDQRLASEMYVTARDEAEAARLGDFLATRADAVLPIWNVDATVAGRPAEIFGVADHATYRDNWPMLAALPGAWDLVAAGTHVLVNEQLARGAGLVPGDRLALPGNGGWQALVAGVYSDYGNPKAQVMVGLGAFDIRYPEAPRLRFGVRVAPEAVPALMAALRDDFGLPATAMADQVEIKRLSLAIFERTFAVSQALNVLTLGVAAFAMLTSLLTLGTLRLPQLAPAWAMGMTRGRLARLELGRAVVLAVLTAVLALPVGLMLAWVLLAVINVEAFGWRLPLHLFPGDWARLGLWALAAAVLAAGWPAARLARLPPARLLRMFADER